MFQYENGVLSDDCPKVLYAVRSKTDGIVDDIIKDTEEDIKHIQNSCYFQAVNT
jgi:hypothetical protein